MADVVRLSSERATQQRPYMTKTLERPGTNIVEYYSRNYSCYAMLPEDIFLKDWGHLKPVSTWEGYTGGRTNEPGFARWYEG